MKKNNMIQFAGKTMPVEELIQLLLIMPEENQKMIYEHGLRMKDKYELRFSFGKKEYSLNIALLAYIRKENRRLNIYFLDRKDPIRIAKMSLKELERYLAEKPNPANPYLRLKSCIFFKGLFHGLSLKDIQNIAELKEFLLFKWKIPAGRKVVFQIREWLSVVFCKC